VRILIIEDERKVANALREGLETEHYEVTIATTGEEGFFLASQRCFDLLLLDLMLPRRDGIDVLATLRKCGNQTPILVVTAKDAVEDRVIGLDQGADDYLTKPFAFGELLARLRAIIRRGTRPIVPELLVVGDVTIDTRSRTATRGGRGIRLTAREYALLEFFARRPGEVIGRSDIAEHVWDDQYDPFSNVIDVYVQRLRRKLDSPGQPSLIATRRGEGYVFG